MSTFWKTAGAFVVAHLLGCAALAHADSGASVDAAGPPPHVDFAALTAELKAKGEARPAILIDLDRLDANIAAIRRHVRAPRVFRVVEKSLPSVELLRYVLEHAGSHRLMAFHYPFLPELLRALPADTSYLFGKTVLPDGVRALLAGLTPAEQSRATQNVQWLIDSEASLRDMAAVFRARKLPWRASFEIDVGLHRGGFATPQALDAGLAEIERMEEEKTGVQFAGLMGYDGHVIHAPAPGFAWAKRWAVGRALADAQARYAAFVAVLRERHPRLWAQATTFNGGGSLTYELYAETDTAVNDLAAGSALLKPTAFDAFTLADHAPAVFIAAPVLKRLNEDAIEIPFASASDGLLGRLLGFVSRLFAGSGPSYMIAGGSWAETAEYPHGIREHPLLQDGAAAPLVPNQEVVFGESDVRLAIGDYVYFRPHESDAIFQFDRIWLVRRGHIVGQWRPFTQRF